MTHDKNEVVGLEKRRSIWQKYWEGRMGRTSDSLNRGSDKGWSPQRSWKLEGEWDHAPSKGRSKSNQNDPGSPATDYLLELCDDSERQPSS